MKLFQGIKLSWVVLGAFFALIVLLWAGLSLDPRFLPSKLIEKPFPSFSLPSVLPHQPMIKTKDILGKVGIVHIWATWCGVCLREHDELMTISKKTSFPIYGILYQDNPIEGQRWLNEHGNPYRHLILDERGRLGLDLGVYGTPETFVIDAKGVIRYRVVGAISMHRFEKELLPILNKLAV